MAAETAEERRRTVGEKKDDEHCDTKKTNKESDGRDAGTSSGGQGEEEKGNRSSDWRMNLKGLFISFTVITLSYMIIAATEPARPSQFSVITNAGPQHCGLKLSARTQNLILDKHNEIRSKVALGLYSVDDEYLPKAANMAKLKWDCELELEAQQRAAECDLRVEKKQQQQQRKMGGLEEVRGENAFYFRTGELDYADGVLKGIERMGDEIAMAGIRETRLSKYDARIGHATQIMWATTRSVGCAVQECSARQDGSLGAQKYNVAVCKYYPTGNVFKSEAPTPIYRAGASGSSCSEGSLADPTSGLCVAVEEQNGGTE